MRRPSRIILPAAIILGALVVLAGASFYGAIWRPNQKLSDEAWCASVSTSELRNLCHHVISRRLGNHHDAFLYLRHVGDAESVPLLIQALRWQKPDGSGVIVCTTDHCVDALRSLTGEDFGYSSSEWERWWKETGSRLAPDHFHPREANERGFLEHRHEPGEGAFVSASALGQVHLGTARPDSGPDPTKLTATLDRFALKYGRFEGSGIVRHSREGGNPERAARTTLAGCPPTRA